jgi:hypothetical protein
MAKSWGYVVSLFVPGAGVPKVFEIEDISPFKIDGGQFLKTKMSEDIAGLANPMLMGQFIASFGNANTLSFKKAKDALTTLLEKAKKDKTQFDAAYVDIAPISSVSSKLSGTARDQAIMLNTMATIGLESVKVTYALLGKSGYGYFTFECEEVKQRFKGRDY